MNEICIVCGKEIEGDKYEVGGDGSATCFQCIDDLINDKKEQEKIDGQGELW